ncbi:MAG: histidine triad nucleotide-binding protein [Bdellovibrionales bacterium]|nr:histidine triad nucleotide-binding protein [Bdellovibrionales bacterium]
MSTLFSQIISRQIPANIVYEDELCLAFRDRHPQAPQHILLIPKKEITSLASVQKEDQLLLGHLMLKAAYIAEQEGFAQKGYRLVTNVGEHGCQTVPHIHFHILGGRFMDWPPG